MLRTAICWESKSKTLMLQFCFRRFCIKSPWNHLFGKMKKKEHKPLLLMTGTAVKAVVAFIVAFYTLEEGFTLYIFEFDFFLF